MIALTQEQREELIAYAKAAIKECDMHGEDYTPRPEMMVAALKVALASLTAVPKSFAWEVPKFPGSTCRITELCQSNSDGAYPLYTAPPVPEIKFPSIDEILDGYKYQASPHDIRLFRFMISAIKRLNGLGE